MNVTRVKKKKMMHSIVPVSSVLTGQHKHRLVMDATNFIKSLCLVAIGVYMSYLGLVL